MASVTKPDDGLLYVKGNLKVADKVTALSTDDIDLENIPSWSQVEDGSAPVALAVAGGGFVQSNFYVGGTFVANGDIVTLGNNGGGITFNGNIASDVLPSDSGLYNLGSPAVMWGSVYSNRLNYSSQPSVISGSYHTEETSLCHINDATPGTVNLTDGAEGQLLTVVCIETPVNNTTSRVLQPISAAGFSTITFTEEGQSVSMIFTNGKWTVTSVFRASVV